MYEEPTQTPEFSALAGLVLGLLGMIGSFFWYSSFDDTGTGSSALAIILGIISLFVFAWSVMMVYFLIRSGREQS